MKLIFYYIAQLAHRDEVNLPQVSAGGGQVQTILRVVFTFAGAVAVLMVAIGGLNYVLSNGEPQRVAKAKDTILYGVIGLIITIFAVTIVTFVIGRIF